MASSSDIESAQSNGCSSDSPASEDPKNAGMLDRYYGELRGLAAYHLSRERANHTLQPTALVHEAYLRLHNQNGSTEADRKQFFSIASEMIRRILVDHARRRNTVKRGGKRQRYMLDELGMSEIGEEPVDILDLNDALEELAKLSPRQARVVELRYFSGLSIAETAETLDISVGSAKGDWRIARAWLRGRLSR